MSVRYLIHFPGADSAVARTQPAFYAFPGSVWCLTPRYAIAELGYADDAIEVKEVDLVKAGNFEPDFLKISPKATLPTLVAGGKVYDNTTDVTSYLIARAPQKAGKASGTDPIEKIHGDSLDPNLAFISARSDAELVAKRPGFAGVFTSSRNARLQELLADPTPEFKEFYQGKAPQVGYLATPHPGNAPSPVKTPFFDKSKQLWASIAKLLEESLAGYLSESEFIGGDKPGEDDFHLGVVESDCSRFG